LVELILLDGWKRIATRSIQNNVIYIQGDLCWIKAGTGGHSSWKDLEMTNEEAHNIFAREAQKKTWQLLEASDRTPEQEAEMIGAAHTSAYHWSIVGTGLNHQRAEWLLARVYSVLGMGERAVFHATRCRDLTELHHDLMEDFDLAFALEGLARAYAAAGDPSQASSLKQQAEAAGQKISDAEDRNYFLLDLASGNWFGL
jgi:hypothetical protein